MAIHMLMKICGSQIPKPVNRGGTPMLTLSVPGSGDCRTFPNAPRPVSPPSLRTCTSLRLHPPHFITLDSEMQTSTYERPSVLSTEAWGSVGDLRHWGSESTQVEAKRPYFIRLSYHARSTATCWVMTSERVALEPGALLRKADTTHRATTPGRPRAQTP